jgi:adenine phosphoribosyltransferase
MRMQIHEALSLIRAIPDYPKPGILFQDITPLLANSEALASVVRELSDLASEFNCVAGIEARGFILATAVATHAHKGFIPIRKAGKLPFTTHSRSYGLEYGSDELEIHTDAFALHSKVYLLDDVLATGGTIEAALGLIRDAGGSCTDIGVLLEIEALGGRKKIAAQFPDVTIHSLVKI